MELSIILTTLLQTFAIGTPDLCDDVYLDPTGAPYTDSVGQTLARYCQWTGPDAPVWAAKVCCTIDHDGAHCAQPDVNGRCSLGLAMYCEYGEAVASGGVVCYQPLPSMCDEGFCVAPPDVPPPGQPVWGACCSAGGVCQFVAVEDTLECNGKYLSCEDGFLHEDGTVECFD